MRSNEIEAKKQKLRLSQTQREIIVGLLLGDGHLETQNGGRTYRLKIEHSLEQKQYVDWLYEYFKEWCGSKPKIKYRDGVERSYYFSTYSHGTFRFYGQQFYPNGEKVIPGLFAKLITPLSLAIWFMDDGSAKSSKHATYVLHTLGYTKDDLEKVKEVLLRKFGITSKLHRQKEKYWRLYIPSESAGTFKKLIQKNIIPSMQYKLSNNLPKR